MVIQSKPPAVGSSAVGWRRGDLTAAWNRLPSPLGAEHSLSLWQGSPAQTLLVICCSLHLGKSFPQQLLFLTLQPHKNHILNLIFKSNFHPHKTAQFFSRVWTFKAIASFFWVMRGSKIISKEQNIMDSFYMPMLFKSLRSHLQALYSACLDKLKSGVRASDNLHFLSCTVVVWKTCFFNEKLQFSHNLESPEVQLQ